MKMAGEVITVCEEEGLEALLPGFWGALARG